MRFRSERSTAVAVSTLCVCGAAHLRLGSRRSGWRRGCCVCVASERKRSAKRTAHFPRCHILVTFLLSAARVPRVQKQHSMDFASSATVDTIETATASTTHKSYQQPPPPPSPSAFTNPSQPATQPTPTILSSSTTTYCKSHHHHDRHSYEKHDPRQESPRARSLTSQKFLDTAPYSCLFSPDTLTHLLRFRSERFPPPLFALPPLVSPPSPPPPPPPLLPFSPALLLPLPLVGLLSVLA